MRGWQHPADRGRKGETRVEMERQGGNVDGGQRLTADPLAAT